MLRSLESRKPGRVLRLVFVLAAILISTLGCGSGPTGSGSSATSLSAGPQSPPPPPPTPTRVSTRGTSEGVLSRVGEETAIPLQPGWNGVSFPLNLESLSFVEDQVMQAFRYDPNSGTYVEQELSVEGLNSRPQTTGVWVFATGSTTLTYTCREEAVGPNRLSLSPGWNWIGFESSAPLPLVNLTVGGQPISQVTADSPGPGQVGTRAFEYDPTQGAYVVLDLSDGRTTFTPHRAVWIFAGGNLSLDERLVNPDGEGFFPAAIFGALPVLDVQVADLNGDGWLDAVGVAQDNSSPSIRIQLNSGAGLLETNADIQNFEADRLQVGDLNGDRQPDFVADQFVFLNEGGGNFSLSGNLTGNTNVSEFELANLDGDGDLDVLAFEAAPQAELRVYRNLGDGTFGAPESTDLGNRRPQNPVFVDFDGVNGIDVVYYEDDVDDLLVILNRGDGTFSAPQLVLDNFALEDFTLLDFNRDGNLDIVYSRSLADAQAAVRFLLNDGLGSFSQVQEVVTPNTTLEFPTPQDVSGDGLVDILANSVRGGELFLILDDGSGTFLPPVTLRGVNRRLSVGDLDKNGEIDIVASSSGAIVSAPFGFVVHYSRNGFRDTPMARLDEEHLDHVTSDLDGDGDLDFAVLFSGELFSHTYLNDGEGNLTMVGTFRTGQDPSGLVAADFNGDRVPDLAAVNSNPFSPGISVAQGVGDGNMGSSTQYETTSQPRGLVAGDFDGDGDIDLAVCVGGDDVIQIFLNGGAGRFSQGPAVPAEDGPRSLLAVDVDGDTDLDFVGAGSSTNRLFLVKNRGDGSFDPPSLINTGTPFPDRVGASDIENDGDMDLIVGHRNNSTGTYAILENNGQGSYSVKITFTDPGIERGTEPFFVDLDRDGDEDLVTRHVRLNDGAGNFAISGIYFFSGDLNGNVNDSYAAGDYDNDGDLDLSFITPVAQFQRALTISLNSAFPGN